MQRQAGNYLRSSTSPEPFQAYVPAPLPPDPPLVITLELQLLLEKANQA